MHERRLVAHLHGVLCGRARVPLRGGALPAVALLGALLDGTYARAQCRPNIAYHSDLTLECTTPCSVQSVLRIVYATTS